MLNRLALPPSTLAFQFKQLTTSSKSPRMPLGPSGVPSPFVSLLSKVAASPAGIQGHPAGGTHHAASKSLQLGETKEVSRQASRRFLISWIPSYNPTSAPS